MQDAMTIKYAKNGSDTYMDTVINYAKNADIYRNSQSTKVQGKLGCCGNK